MRNPRAKFGRVRKFVAASLGTLLALGMVAAPQAGIAADIEQPATLSIQKGVTKTHITPGDTFEYTIEAACSSLTVDGCVNAVLEDPISPYFQIISAVATVNQVGHPTSINPATNTVRVEFTQKLEGGTVGLRENQTVNLAVRVKFKDSPMPPHDISGIEIPNTATITADNANPDKATAPVIPQVEPKLGATVTKTFEPAIDRPVPGTTTTVTLAAKNTTNGAVDSFGISDPAAGQASQAFTYLELVGVKEIAWPEGAATATVEYFDGNTWQTGETVTKPALPGAPSFDAQGVRVTFRAADGERIPRDASADLKLTMKQRENVTELDEITRLTNTAVADVTVGDLTGTSPVADAAYTIYAVKLTAGATKTFTPDVVLPTQQTSINLTGKNTNDVSVEGLYLREPSAGTFDERLTFDGFTSRVQYPAGADSGDLQLTYLDKDGAEQVFNSALTNGAGFPALPDNFGRLLNFEIRYLSSTKALISGAETALTFNATAVDGLAKDDTIDNEVVVGVISGADTGESVADDTLTIDTKRVDISTSKKINPGRIWGYAGEVATLQLPTTVERTSTTNAQKITVNDPALNADGTPTASEWWNHFRPLSVTKTDVPANATMTVRYFDTTTNTWEELFTDIAGPQQYTADIPAHIRDKVGGLQFVFTNTGNGFSPGSIVQPNITTELTKSLPAQPEGDDIQVQNCSSASASAPASSTGTATTSPCPSIQVDAPLPGNGYDLLSKSWTAPAPAAIVGARSGESATSRLNWSTGGLSGIDEFRLSDTRTGSAQGAGPVDAVEDTTYEAFNLTAINAITAQMDPHLKWDLITAVELWNGSSWKKATNATGLPYTGSMPRIALTAAEQASTTAVRLTYAENTVARKVGNIDAPAAGSGVMRSSGNDRKVDLTWVIRDTKRSDGTPVLGSDLYNTQTRGDVDNIASAVAVRGEDVLRDEDSDIVSILDRPLLVSVVKDWTGGPLGMPIDGTTPDKFPSGRVTITAKNETVAKVDKLQVIDAKDGGANPFDVFNIKKIITLPDSVTGSTSARVMLTNADGSTFERTPAQARALTAAQLANVVKLEVSYEGRIASKAEAKIVLDMQLRATNRSTGETITPSVGKISNDAQAVVTDAGGVNNEHTVDATDGADITLLAQNISIVTTKSFSPDKQFVELLPSEPTYDDEPWSSVTMNLSAQPGGSARPATMIVTDDTATFWNAYRFVGFGGAKGEAFNLASPIDRVQVDVLTGGTFEEQSDGSIKLVGAHWVTGSAANTPKLPTGVTAAEVQGLRFTFTRDDGLQWENPANPTQRLPLTVHRRAYLASDPKTDTNPGTPVPNNVEDAAPGEEKGGEFTNTVAGEIIGAVNAPGNIPLTATHSSTAKISYESGRTEVKVVKTPSGQQRPGENIPFTLQVTNTAPTSSGMEKSILNPVIVDTLPVDADGKPWLIFDEERDEPRYAYEYQAQATPANPNTPMPTDPAKITVTEEKNSAGEITSIRFTFPDGTVIMPGETYTITVNMIFRPGIAANYEVSNGLGITADEPFARCNDVDYDPMKPVCDTTTQVNPAAYGAIRGQKFVKADDTELGVNDIGDAAAVCEPALADSVGEFYARNCVPVTKPLGTETWREMVQNIGTIGMDSVVTIDRLPTPGDKGSWLNNARGSQWQPLWVGNLTAVSAPGYRVPTEARYYYSSAENPCTGDLTPGATPCPDGVWLELTADVDPKLVKHIKTVFDFAGNPLRPGERMGYTFQTRTPAVSPTATKDTVAWNTIALGATLEQRDSAGRVEVLPTEGRRVGVALATGPLAVEKFITGPGKKFAPANFQIQVSCTVGTGDLKTSIPVVLANVPADKETTLVQQFPWGAECEGSDVPGVNGETTSLTGDKVTVGRDTDPLPIVTVTNDYQLSSFSATKLVTGATDQDGNAVDYGTFPFQAVCTFLGSPVWGEGFTASPMTKSLAHGETWTVSGLPVGAECTVTETDAKGGSTTIEQAPVVGPGAPVAGTSTKFTLDRQAQDAPLVRVIVRNTMPLGAVTLKKVVAGAGAALVSDTTAYTLQLVCTRAGTTVYDDTFTFTKAEALATPAKEVRVEKLPTDASCAVTETEKGGAVSSIAPAGSVTVGTARAFTATNTYNTGAINVTKVLAGEGASLWGTKPFEVALSCTFGGEPFEIPGEARRTISAAQPTTSYTDLPIGSVCDLTETNTGGAHSTTITDAADAGNGKGITVGTAPVAMKVTNTFNVGSINVIKSVAGDGASWGVGPFEVALTCEYNGENIDASIPGGATRELNAANNLTASYTKLPIDAECEISETKTAGATASTILVNGEKPEGAAKLTVAQDDAEVTVVNRFSVGSIAVTKSILGDGGDAFGVGPFDLTLVCSFAGNDNIDIPGGATRTVSSERGLRAVFEGLPIGADCTVTETDAAGATATRVVDANGDEVTGPITVAAGDALEVTVENTFDVGSITVTKEVTGAGASLWGAGPFEVALACSFNGAELPADKIPGGATRELNAANQLTAEYTGLPLGAGCEISESKAGGATSTEIFVNDVVAADKATLTIGKDAVSVKVINTFDMGAISVTKQVTGAGADQWGAGPFDITLACTFNGAEIEIPGGAVKTISDGETALYENLPLNAECDVTESNAGGATKSEIVNANGDVIVAEGDTALVKVVVAAGEPQAFTAVNTFDLGEIQVTKQVTGAGVDLYGKGPFEVLLSCTFNGKDIQIPGEAQRPIVAGETLTYTDLPVGAACDVTEPVTGGASIVTLTDAADVVIDEKVKVAAEPFAVTVTNTFELGEISVTKQVTGAGVDLYGKGPFEVLLTCEFNGGPIEIPGHAQREIAIDETLTYTDLPIGAACEVTEPVTGGASDVVVTDAKRETVGIATVATEPLELTLTNTFGLGEINVTKKIDGAGAEAYGTGEFEVTLACTFQTRGIEIPGGASRTIKAGETATFGELPIGADCTVDETKTAGATNVTIIGVDGETVTNKVAVAADPSTLTVTNTFGLGEINVTKKIDGAGAEAYGTGEFEMSLSCTFNGNKIATPGGDTRVIKAGETAKFGELPIGADCDVTETKNGGATSTDIATSPAKVGAEPVTVTVTNTFELGEIAVTKKLLGDGSDTHGAGPFEVSLACTFNGADMEIPGGSKRAIVADETVTYGDLPVGAACDVTESVTGGASSVLITDSEDKVITTKVTVATDPVAVTVTNVFGLGEINVTKKVVGAGAEAYGTGEFEVALACTFQDGGIEIPGGASRTIKAGETATFSGLPIGADCDVTEPKDGGATASAIDKGAVTVGAEPVTVTVTNTFALGSIEVVKKLDGDGAKENVDNAFDVELTCVFNDSDIKIPGGEVRTLRQSGNFRTVFESLPVGADCEVRETDNGGAAKTVITPNSGDKLVGTVTVPEGAAAEVTVVNTFPGEEPGGGNTGGPTQTPTPEPTPTDEPTQTPTPEPTPTDEPTTTPTPEPTTTDGTGTPTPTSSTGSTDGASQSPLPATGLQLSAGGVLGALALIIGGLVLVATGRTRSRTR